MKRQLFALLGVIALVGVAVGPAMAAASGTAANASAANAPLAIGVTQDDGVTVTVTANGSGVADASVDVATVEDNATYAGTGSYTTGQNGTVGLPTPNESVAVSITATEGNRTAETTATLIGAGENATFGQQVSSLVHALQASTEGGIGGAVSSWVTANNPGNAPEHAGGPGGPNATENDSERGPPAFVQAFLDANERMNNESEDRPRGPPAHAGGPDDANETEDETEDENETEDDTESEDERRGPPADAGPDGDRGNGNGPSNAGPSDDGDDEADEETEDEADDESTASDA